LARPRDLPRAPDEPDRASRAAPDEPDRVPRSDGGGQPDRRVPAGDERRMRALETLPPGHPSSPYLADGSRRPERPSLRDLEPPDEKPVNDRPLPPETRDQYWTQVTRFTGMWADHLHKWPKDKQPAASVDRSQDAPGSWRSDSNVFLGPETHARTKDAISGLRRAEPRVTGDLQDVIRESPFGPELVGLEFRSKGEERLKEKVAESLQRRPDAEPEESVRSINDGIRYTIRLSVDNYASGYQDISERLEASGYVMFYGRNSWSDPEYKGINTRWVTPEGQRFEVQFHTPESYHAKQEITHEAYERIRNPLTNNDERSELKAFQREVTSWIPVPVGAKDIPDHRKEHS
jgi:hypothetical protein